MTTTTTTPPDAVTGHDDRSGSDGEHPFGYVYGQDWRVLYATTPLRECPDLPDGTVVVLNNGNGGWGPVTSARADAAVDYLTARYPHLTVHPTPLTD